MPARANAVQTLGHPASIWASSAGEVQRQLLVPLAVLTCWQAKQGCVASGGVPPMMLCPGVMDVLEESWAQDQHLSEEWSDQVLSMLEQNSQPNTVQPLALCSAESCLQLRSWSPQSHYLVPVSFDELFDSHMCCKSRGNQ